MTPPAFGSHPCRLRYVDSAAEDSRLFIPYIASGTEPSRLTSGSRNQLSWTANTNRITRTALLETCIAFPIGYSPDVEWMAEYTDAFNVPLADKLYDEHLETLKAEGFLE